jgi:hypothetical protein
MSTRAGLDGTEHISSPFALVLAVTLGDYARAGSVANPPSGSLTGADVVISLAAAAAQVAIATKNIPPGTAVNLRINSETVADQSITCAPITGTLALGSATCQATFPLGANITIASATW